MPKESSDDDAARAPENERRDQLSTPSALELDPSRRELRSKYRPTLLAFAPVNAHPVVERYGLHAVADTGAYASKVVDAQILSACMPAWLVGNRKLHKRCSICKLKCGSKCARERHWQRCFAVTVLCTLARAIPRCFASCNVCANPATGVCAHARAWVPVALDAAE